jgi:hypothetical protein
LDQTGSVAAWLFAVAPASAAAACLVYFLKERRAESGSVAQGAEGISREVITSA